MLTKHIRLNHAEIYEEMKNKDKLLCSFCDFKSKCKNLLNNHMKHCHVEQYEIIKKRRKIQNKKYHCNDCDVHTDNKVTYNNHMRRVHR